MNKELDKWVLENIMGWKWLYTNEGHKGDDTTPIEPEFDYQCWFTPEGDYYLEEDMRPTSDIGDALEALGKYNELVKYNPKKMLFFETTGVGWNINSDFTEQRNGVLKDAPLEICKMIKKWSKKDE